MTRATHKISFRRWWHRVALFASLAVVLPTSAVDLKIASVAPDGSSWMQQMRAGASEIQQRTGGRVVGHDEFQRALHDE